jgi:hypothetical protein
MSPSITAKIGQYYQRVWQGLAPTLVWFALLSKFAGGLDGRFGSVFAEILVRHDLTTDELIFEVGAVAVISKSVMAMKTFTDWMTPAACGAFVPLRIVHARTSSGPQVKYRMS